VDSKETQYERLMAALDTVRARIPAILAEARAAEAESVTVRAESARIGSALEAALREAS
jgi:hypothetical protein